MIDRAKTANPRVQPTWIINLPHRPTVDQSDLPPETRLAGSDNDAGVWRCDDARWLRWQDRDGALWLRCLLPEPRRVTVVGGPGSKLLIPDGRHKGRTYVGGIPDGFERLISASGRPRPANAWYRLGHPTLLGPQFGTRPPWGRVEVEPISLDEQYLFINVLAVDEARSATPPAVHLQGDDESVTIVVTLANRRTRLILPKAHAIGGELQSDAPGEARWSLPSNVAVDAPLPVK